ncbi:MAG TPA: hypothetical protein VG847_08480 [Chitinophagaceae bacterium]|nr:hypothetical protein [Chitinophagaceae bacterium]
MSDVQVLGKVENLLGEVISQSGTMFTVGVKISPSNNIRVFIDADDGITIEKCTIVNRALYKRIEESGLFPGGNFSLEVSSPGVDEPLKLHRQYEKNIGRNVEATLSDGSKITGKLVTVNHQDMVVEEKTGKGNKAVIKPINILFSQVKQTKVLITF